VATFREFLEANRAEICRTIYGGDTQFAGVVDEVVRIARSERGAAITLCDPRSIIDAVRLAASWPVKIGTQDGAALVVTDEIVPRSQKFKLIAMQTARAKIDILNRFGGLRWFNARCVFSGEAFRAQQGENPRIVEHDDLTLYPQRRGALVGAYASGLQKHGLPGVLELMNRHDIDEIRKEYSRELRDGELEDLEHFEQYCVAKAIHRFVKRIALNEQTRKWLDDGGQARAPDVEPATITVPVADPRGVVEAVMACRKAAGLPARSTHECLTASVL
jgi:hypothetical protein